MKKMKFFLGLAIVAISLFFMSCNPTGTLKIAVNPENVTAVPGETVSFTAVVTPDALNGVDLGKLTISVNTDSVIYTKDFAGESSSDSVIFSYTVPSTAKVGNDIILSFKIVDKSGNNPASTVANITVGANLVTTSKTITYNSTSTSTPLGLTLKSDGADIFTADQTTSPDLVYFAQSTYGHTIWSPDAKAIANQDGYSSWNYSVSSPKATAIQKYAGDFSELDASTLDTLTVTGESPADYPAGGIGADHLKVGDIYVFKTADGRKGAFKVTSASTITKGILYDSNITLDLVYQANASSGK